MKHYKIAIIAEVVSSLPKKKLESKLVASLFDIETNTKISDGDTKQFEVIDYELTEAVSV